MRTIEKIKAHCKECEIKCQNCAFWHSRNTWEEVKTQAECKDCVDHSNHIYDSNFCPECGRKLKERERNG